VLLTAPVTIVSFGHWIDLCVFLTAPVTIVSFGHWIDLFVLLTAPVTMLILSNTAASNDDYNSSSVTLHFTENYSSTLRCRSLGGSPPPSLDVRIGDQDVTRSFSLRSVRAYADGKPGLRRLTYSVERANYRYMASADHNHVTCSCVAVVNGLKPVIETVTLDVDCVYYRSFIYFIII